MIYIVINTFQGVDKVAYCESEDKVNDALKATHNIANIKVFKAEPVQLKSQQSIVMEGKPPLAQ